ncbi:hypothetical protein LOK49_LG04G00710 [Camellia lanceoleosa]|uniref:Uncharacterized protein n=1 Tax=Camellia lanceoleosa TaxID=1840588 RepID=A0ACC0HZQ9_9ERIC|nr:hypothetical protein LOK49_LG04G00710 [Camellia lanceoleosa]
MVDRQDNQWVDPAVNRFEAFTCWLMTQALHRAIELKKLMHDVEMEVITATVANDVLVERLPIVVIDSDDEETRDQKSLYPYRDFVLP